MRSPRVRHWVRGEKPTTKSFKIGNNYKTGDGYNIRFDNAATASLYRYTPYVYWGNYNVFKIMASNGWTVNNTGGSFNDIDKVNKVNSSTPTNQADECIDIVKKRYTFGTYSEENKNLQKCLIKYNSFNYSSATGYFGNITLTGIKSYLGNKDWCEKFTYNSYRIGDSGEEIRRLQQCLKDNNLFDFPNITGYYGPITNAGLIRYKNR